jgi:hypothetical protein
LEQFSSGGKNVLARKNAFLNASVHFFLLTVLFFLLAPHFTKRSEEATYYYRACLVCAQTHHAKSGARQNIGEGFVRSRFASA